MTRPQSQHLEHWQQYTYPIKKIWLKRLGGSVQGVFVIHALTLREKKDKTVQPNSTKEPRLHTFSFIPDRERKDLYIQNFLNKDGAADHELVPNHLKSYLLDYIQLLLENMQDWKVGTKKIYFRQKGFGTFCIEQSPCMIPKKYSPLLELGRKAFEETVNTKHPLHRLLNNDTKDYELIYK